MTHFRTTVTLTVCSYMSRTRIRVNPHSIFRLRTKWLWVRVQLQSLQRSLFLPPENMRQSFRRYKKDINLNWIILMNLILWKGYFSILWKNFRQLRVLIFKKLTPKEPPPLLRTLNNLSRIPCISNAHTIFSKTRESIPRI